MTGRRGRLVRPGEPAARERVTPAPVKWSGGQLAAGSRAEVGGQVVEIRGLERCAIWASCAATCRALSWMQIAIQPGTRENLQNPQYVQQLARKQAGKPPSWPLGF